ncbi:MULTISPECIES: PadR family transcriptional regulator [unclassified Microbulbifer]|uniref:PadR family transcriptional regulator n=1 Tax=unclassified Microbulbifer TaxID=2619833 RepID=UPI0027E3C509|nr:MULTISPECIES: PadR family transcriptional regulator [unclassified Microbulbifer]
MVHSMEGKVTLAPDRLNKLIMEMRRGVVILAVLRALGSSHYGYSLRKRLAAIGLEMDEGTLYPLLRRLEDQGLLTSEWKLQDGRKRRFYRISEDGETALQQMAAEWRKLNGAIEQLGEKT